MCNRFNAAVKVDQIEKMFSAKAVENLAYSASYNVAPTDRVPFILEKDDQEREIHLGRFGMPTFATPVQTNIRLEKAQNLKFLKSRRCIIPSPGFYEFAAIGPKEKQAHFFTPAEPDGLFAYAGSWKETPNGLAFAIFTTEPNEIVAPVHDRMPVLLAAPDWPRWLTGTMPNVLRT